MAQLFPSYANTLIRAGIVGAILGAHGLAAAALIFVRSPYTTGSETRQRNRFSSVMRTM